MMYTMISLLSRSFIVWALWWVLVGLVAGLPSLTFIAVMMMILIFDVVVLPIRVRLSQLVKTPRVDIS